MTQDERILTEAERFPEAATGYIEEVIRIAKERRKERDEARELARRMDQNASGWLCGEEFDAELNAIPWLKEIR